MNTHFCNRHPSHQVYPSAALGSNINLSESTSSSARCNVNIFAKQTVAYTWLCFSKDDSGVTAIEYGLLASLIAVAAIAAFTATGTSLGAMYTVWSAAVVAAL